MAGILAALFAWDMVKSPPGLLHGISMAMLSVVFATFAIFGREAADKLHSQLTGRNRRQPPDTL